MVNSLESQIEQQARQLAVLAGVSSDAVKVVISPYRVCPIGAHSDHQGGPVLGMTVSAYTLLAFVPAPGSELVLTSENYPGEVRVDLSDSSPSVDAGWSRYVHGTARAFAERFPSSSQAMIGRVSGDLPAGGLSSSASMTLAYLTALAEVNSLSLEPHDLIQLALHAENKFVGVRVGILDPATIVSARREHLVAIDTRNTQWELLPYGSGEYRYRILIVFSGITRNLVDSAFNSRVNEALAAARQLAVLSERNNVLGLHDLPDAVFDAYGDQLPPREKRRARHFFAERTRVVRGKELWAQGDVEGFGRLMKESCESSIHNWESGSPELLAIYELLAGTPGIFGCRFSGAGWGGCCLALIDSRRAESIRWEVEQHLSLRLPRLREARVFLVDSEDGIRLVSAS